MFLSKKARTLNEQKAWSPKNHLHCQTSKWKQIFVTTKVSVRSGIERRSTKELSTTANFGTSPVGQNNAQHNKSFFENVKLDEYIVGLFVI